MKLRTKILAATGAAILSTSAVALDFDLRHEYKDSNATKNGNTSRVTAGEHASRFKFGHTFKINKDWKSNLSLETKFKSDDATEFMTDVYINEMELDMGLTYKLGGGWELKPGMPINVAFDEPNDNGDKWFYMKKVTYKPQLRVQHTYKAESFKFKNALRYRHEFADFRDASMGSQSAADRGDKDLDGNRVSNPQKMKITYTGAFTPKAMKKLYFAWEANYVRSLDNVAQGVNNSLFDWDAGVFLGYRFGNFRPYVEYWNIKNGGYGTTNKGSKTADDKRGNKYRIGLKYYWK